MWSSSSLQNPILHIPIPQVHKSPNPCIFSIPKSQFFHQTLVSSAAKQRPRLVAAAAAKSPGSKDSAEQQKWTNEGLVTESLPNGMFRIKLDNSDLIIGYISGKIRKSFIRILPGDRVRVEVSRYDSTRGRIVYRLRNTKDPS